MTPETRDWLEGLREFAAGERLQRPLPDLARSDPEQAAERSILGAHLATRLAEIDDVVEARRAWCRAADQSQPADEDPCLVITTSAAGMAALDDLLRSGNPVFSKLAGRIATVTELEYRLWCIRRPDDGRRLHVNAWSWVKTRLPEQRLAEFARHRLTPGEIFWLHRTGLAGAGRADRRDCHLWKWNGRHAALLEAFVRERSGGRLAAGRGRREHPPHD
jgi:hypothetical protein